MSEEASTGSEGGRRSSAFVQRRHAIIRHLPYFVVVAEQEHFQRAADILNMTQPALSRRIQDMEEVLGVALFERKRRGVTLTPAGRVLRDDAARIMEAMDGAIHRVHAMADTGAQHLRLSFNEAALRTPAVIEAVEAFRQACPDVEIEMLPMLTEAQLAALQRRELDACFLYDFGFRQLGLSVAHLASLPMLLAMPADHALARQPVIRLRDLANEPMAWPSRTAGVRLNERMDAAWAAAGVTPRIIMEVLTTETTMSLVASHIAMGFVDPAASPPPGVILKPIADFNVELELSLVWHPQNTAPPLERLIALVLERGEK